VERGAAPVRDGMRFVFSLAAVPEAPGK